MSNFTVKLIFTRLDDEGREVDAQRFYTCRTFDFTDPNEMVLRGLNGSGEDAVLWIDSDPYDQVFVTNDAGKTVFAYRGAIKVKA